MAEFRRRVEEALPVVFREPQSQGMKSMWQAMQEDFAAGRAFPRATEVTFVEIRTWDQLEAYYDQAPSGQQRWIIDWLVKTL